MRAASVWDICLFGERIEVRDSKDPRGPALWFTSVE
jgi:hypothetical protein